MKLSLVLISGVFLLSACTQTSIEETSTAKSISNGVDSPAKADDILFARAWGYNGVKAANDSPLEFVVFKYSGHGVETPTNPNPELPEEVAE